MIKLKPEYVEIIATLRHDGFSFNPIEKNGDWYITEIELNNFATSQYYSAILNMIYES